MGERPSDTVWHVVQTQPRTRPFQVLAEAVSEAAKRLGLSLADRGTLEGWARSGDPDQVHPVLDRMEARLAARPEILKQRREIAEHPAA
jgi:hypothetical protein